MLDIYNEYYAEASKLNVCLIQISLSFDYIEVCINPKINYLELLLFYHRYCIKKLMSHSIRSSDLNG